MILSCVFRSLCWLGKLRSRQCKNCQFPESLDRKIGRLANEMIRLSSYCGASKKCKIIRDRNFVALVWPATVVMLLVMIVLLNHEFHWRRQIATTLRKFHWQFWIIFLDAMAKAKKLIRKSIAQNLMPVSLTKSFLASAMAFNLLLSNLT